MTKKTKQTPADLALAGLSRARPTRRSVRCCAAGTSLRRDEGRGQLLPPRTQGQGPDAAVAEEAAEEGGVEGGGRMNTGCDRTPAVQLRWVGGVLCLPGREQPPFDQLVARVLSLSPADRAGWFQAHGRALRRRAAGPAPKPS